MQNSIQTIVWCGGALNKNKTFKWIQIVLASFSVKPFQCFFSCSLYFGRISACIWIVPIRTSYSLLQNTKLIESAVVILSPHLLMCHEKWIVNPLHKAFLSLLIHSFCACVTLCVVPFVCVWGHLNGEPLSNTKLCAHFYYDLHTWLMTCCSSYLLRSKEIITHPNIYVICMYAGGTRHCAVAHAW